MKLIRAALACASLLLAADAAMAQPHRGGYGGGWRGGYYGHGYAGRGYYHRGYGGYYGWGWPYGGFGLGLGLGLAYPWYGPYAYYPPAYAYAPPPPSGYYYYQRPYACGTWSWDPAGRRYLWLPC